MVPEITSRIDPVVRESWRLFVKLLGADEGSLWLRDGDAGLVMVLNSGPDSASLELTATTHSEDAQVIRCLKTGAPVEDVAPVQAAVTRYRHDNMLDQETVCQVSGPFHWDHDRVGVLSIVQLDRDPPAASRH